MTEQPQPTPPTTTPAVYQPQPMLESDARLWSLLINLATVLGAVVSGGLLGVVGVLVIWLIYRERSALVDFHGKQQLNLNITSAIAGIATVVIGIVTFGIGFIVLGIPLVAYLIYAFVISIVAGVAANRGEYYRIPLIIRFIK
ncbi:DUF4870 domain-containing protein [Demequina sp.]|uniref:DUF4870 domain-containing protein n=1 Tax=Demequina sp. TaxID=2050685 RepID=UPI003D101373